jgi:ABC-2 type transport system ATP-binding protein
VFLSAVAGLSGCGGGTSIGGLTPNLHSGGSPTGSPTGSPGGGSGATSAPTNPAAGPTPVATATPGSGSPLAPPTAPPNAPGYSNVVPATPAPGACRAGTYYNIYVEPPTGDTVAFTVFEPATICGGQTYPLVLHSEGFGGERQTSPSPLPGTTLLSPGNVDQLVDANYGVISFDERGFGQTSGTDRVMDPDYEGVDDIAVMNWAQAKLAWIAYGPTLDGKDPHEPVMGSIGGSYGGMYQYMLLDIDPRHRLRAIVPQIAPFDLNFSLFQDTVIKFEWDSLLFGIGTSGGEGLQLANFAPFVTNRFIEDFEANAEDPYFHDFLGYHSDSYFCNGTPIATNGGPGTMPLHAPVHPPLINALVWIGIRDTLFNFNNGYNNATCLRQSGGDVRLLSYQYGHNATTVAPLDAGLVFLPVGDQLNEGCGNVNVDDATLAFFNQYLKKMAGAASAIPTQPCLSIEAGDAVTVPTVPTGRSGTEFTIPSSLVVSGLQVDLPTAVTLPFTPPSGGTVVGGIPHLEVTVAPTGIAIGAPIIFAGIGQMHASAPGIWDLVDNQVTPIRGTGTFVLDMPGVAARFAAGDQLALLLYGLQDQYVATGSVNVAAPVVAPVTVSGNLWITDFGPLPSLTTTL